MVEVVHGPLKNVGRLLRKDIHHAPDTVGG
jgi:hypothetical protein